MAIDKTVLEAGEKVRLWEDNDRICLVYCGGPEETGKAEGKEGKPAVIVCPGGGYMILADREAEPVARRFATEGYHAFVLRYSTYKTGNSVFPQPVFDLAKAVMLLKQNAKHWNIDENRIAVCGLSAGGHAAASLGVFWNHQFMQEKFPGAGKNIRPDALVLCYPVVDQTLARGQWTSVSEDGKIIDMMELCRKATFGKPNPTEEEKKKISPVYFVSAEMPPAFIWHTAEDDMVPVEGALKFGLELLKHKVPFELHIFEKGPHALSLCDSTTTSDENLLQLTCREWPRLALNWLEKHMK
jgi:acetyl esterase/lipase